MSMHIEGSGSVRSQYELKPVGQSRENFSKATLPPLKTLEARAEAAAKDWNTSRLTSEKAQVNLEKYNNLGLGGKAGEVIKDILLTAIVSPLLLVIGIFGLLTSGPKAFKIFEKLGDTVFPFLRGVDEAKLNAKATAAKEALDAADKALGKAAQDVADKQGGY